MTKSYKKNRRKRRSYKPIRCSFCIDTNNLINCQMINVIINKIDDKTITRLNEVLNGIKFYVGGKQWHIDEKGFIKYPTFEYNFHDRTLLIFLNKIFELGYTRWKNMLYGGLRRFIWESFCHEIIMSLVHIIKLNQNLAKLAKEYYLNKDNDFNKKFISELFNHKENYPLRVNFISINNNLWHENIPELGFLDILYRRRMNKLKSKLNRSGYSPYFKTRYFNELRKQKLNYKFEYNLSELINYCIHNDHFETIFRNNHDFHRKFYSEFYYKAKRHILNFFKKYNIFNELKEYRDSANRTHYFLTHKTFERVKSVCLQTCLARIKNKALLDYQDFRDFYSKCPICKEDYINQQNCEKFYFNPKFSYFKDILISKMIQTSEFHNLNNSNNYFGIPCENCFRIVRNIQGKFSDLDLLQKFIINYNSCPICGAKNHENYLLSFYYNDNKKELKENLIKYMDKNKKIKNIKLNFGIPCCHCFMKIFGEEPDSHIFNYL